MDLESLSFEIVDIPKINRDLELESRYNICDSKYNKKGKQTSISDFVN
jgi:hypothetical protein